MAQKEKKIDKEKEYKLSKIFDARHIEPEDVIRSGDPAKKSDSAKKKEKSEEKAKAKDDSYVAEEKAIQDNSPVDEPIQESLTELLNQEPEVEWTEVEELNLIEALIFASQDGLSFKKLKELSGIRLTEKKLERIIKKTNERLKKQKHPFELVQVAGTFQFRTIQKYQSWIKNLAADKVSRRLSQASLETLSIIAYRQPITRADIENIRGVAADGAIKTLLDRKLVTIAGRSDNPGRAITYGTTKYFLKYFGLKDLNEMPKLEELEEIINAKSQDLIQDQNTNLDNSLVQESGDEIETEANKEFLEAGIEEEQKIQWADPNSPQREEELDTVQTPSESMSEDQEQEDEDEEDEEDEEENPEAELSNESDNNGKNDNDSENSSDSSIKDLLY